MLTKNILRTSGSCHLLGGIFSSFVQGCLAVLCIGTLMIKRQQESPRRDWFVWSLDVGKQGMGSLIGHVANIYLSIVISKSVSSGDECQWYCLTYVVDCAVGTVLNIFFIRVCEKLYERFPRLEFLDFGFYGNPPSLLLWTPQLIVWLTIVILSKIIILLVLKHFISPLNTLVGFLFLIFTGQPDLELVFVMIVVPLILNTLIFWIVDTFLKRQDHSSVAQPDPDEEAPLVENSDDEGSLTHRTVLRAGSGTITLDAATVPAANLTSSHTILAAAKRLVSKKDKLSPVSSMASLNGGNETDQEQDSSYLAQWFGGSNNAKGNKSGVAATVDKNATLTGAASSTPLKTRGVNIELKSSAPSTTPPQLHSNLAKNPLNAHSLSAHSVGGGGGGLHGRRKTDNAEEIEAALASLNARSAPNDRTPSSESSTGTASVEAF